MCPIQLATQCVAIWENQIKLSHVFQIRDCITFSKFLCQLLKNKVGTKEIIPTFDTDWSDAAYRNIQGNVRTKFPEITTLSFFAYANWSEVDMYRIDLRRYW